VLCEPTEFRHVPAWGQTSREVISSVCGHRAIACLNDARLELILIVFAKLEPDDLSGAFVSLRADHGATAGQQLFRYPFDAACGAQRIVVSA